jgi:hypothetical protein
MVGWNIRPKHLISQLFLKIKCLLIFLSYYELIVVCFYSVYEKELYVVVINLLFSFMFV